MKKIMIIVIALIVLGGGGFVAWKFALQPKNEKPVEVKLTDLTAAQITSLTVPMAADSQIETNLADGGHITLMFDVVLDTDKAKTEMLNRNSEKFSTALGVLMSSSTADLNGGAGKSKLEDTLKNKFNEWMKNGKVVAVFITKMKLY